jgi:glycosyltransferase involved in cell wall biosynthesis
MKPSQSTSETQKTQQTQETQQTSIARPKVVAAIPCFNTEGSITDVVKRTRRYVDQVIVIDDGSQDGTAEAAKAAGALVINHGINKGYGEAIKSCFQAAKANAADVLVILDGDGQHNPDEIPRLLAPILNNEADLVIGSRFLPQTQQTQRTQRTQGTQRTVMPHYRKFGISVITFLWNFGSRVKVSDSQSGFRAYSKRMFGNIPLSEKGMSVSIEVLEKARRKGAIIKEVPISCLYPPSTLDLKATRHGLSVALSVVRIRLKSTLRSLIGGSNA